MMLRIYHIFHSSRVSITSMKQMIPTRAIQPYSKLDSDQALQMTQKLRLTDKHSARVADSWRKRHPCQPFISINLFRNPPLIRARAPHALKMILKLQTPIEVSPHFEMMTTLIE